MDFCSRKSVQVNQIKQALDRRTEAEKVLKLLTSQPSTYGIIAQHCRSSIHDLVVGLSSAVITPDDVTESAVGTGSGAATFDGPHFDHALESSC